MKYLIAGLGNIGSEYDKTRHNIGFMILDHLVKMENGKFELAKLAFNSEIKHKGRSIHLIKPTTYMNLSGKSLNYWMQELKIPVENVLAITDDVALPFGQIRMRPSGSNGGHNGLGNIQEILGTVNYPRMRIGVGNDYPKGKQVEYVLGEFNSFEKSELPLLLDKAVEATLSFCTIGLERTMNIYNKK